MWGGTKCRAETLDPALVQMLVISPCPCQGSPGTRVGRGKTCAADGAIGHRRSPAEAGPDIPWSLRDVARFAARDRNMNPALWWGSGTVIQRTQDAVAGWCATHLGPIEVIEAEGGRVLRFATEADLLLFRLRWL